MSNFVVSVAGQLCHIVMFSNIENHFFYVDAPATDHTQDLFNQVPSNKEEEKVKFKDKALETLMENNITDQNIYTFEGLQKKAIIQQAVLILLP